MSFVCAQEEFDAVLQGSTQQLERQRPDVDVSANDLLAVDATGGSITEAGLRTNIHVGIRYIASWLDGTGAAAIHNLMEDAATAEISRGQVWQWVQHNSVLEDGREVTAELVQSLITDELVVIAEEIGAESFAAMPFVEAQEIFQDLALSDTFEEFLTIPAYKILK